MSSTKRVSSSARTSRNKRAPIPAPLEGVFHCWMCGSVLVSAIHEEDGTITGVCHGENCEGRGQRISAIENDTEET